MTEKRDTSADQLAFSQHYGYEPLPEPMRLEHISDDLRREIWNALREFLNHDAGIYSFSSTTRKFIERVLGTFLKRSEDEIPTDYDRVMTIFKNHLFQAKFNEFLDIVQIVINDEAISVDSVNHIAESFERCAAAYWLDTSSHPFRFPLVAAKSKAKRPGKPLRRFAKAAWKAQQRTYAKRRHASMSGGSQIQ